MAQIRRLSNSLLDEPAFANLQINQPVSKRVSKIAFTIPADLDDGRVGLSYAHIFKATFDARMTMEATVDGIYATIAFSPAVPRIEITKTLDLAAQVTGWRPPEVDITKL